MKSIGATRTKIHKIIITSLLCCLFLTATFSPSCAGDLFIFNKIGVMDWNETDHSGKQYMRETGPTAELGIGYRDAAYGIEIAPAASIWGAVLDFEGSHADTDTPWRTTTSSAGIKGVLDFAVPVHFSDNLSIAPTAGAGINYFSRTIGNETWVSLTAKAGLRVSYKKFSASVGTMHPFYTTNKVNWRDIGMECSLTLKPKGQFSPYSELSYRIGKFEIGAYFEQLKWLASAPVTYKNFNSNKSGVVMEKNGFLYQPETIVNKGGLSISYLF